LGLNRCAALGKQPVLSGSRDSLLKSDKINVGLRERYLHRLQCHRYRGGKGCQGGLNFFDARAAMQPFKWVDDHALTHPMNCSTMHGVQIPPGSKRNKFMNWAIEGGH
jgi:hypothetical protein